MDSTGSESVAGFHLGLEKRGNATPHVCKKGVELPIANEKKGRGLELQLGVENLHWINE